MKKILLLFIFSFLIFSNDFADTYETGQALKLNKLFIKLSKNKDYEEADILEKEIWAIWNKHPNNKKLTKKLEFGTKLMYKGSYDDALKVFNNIVNSDPDWPEAWNKRATLFFFMNDYQKSLNDIVKVLNLEPRHFGALSGRAQIYIELNSYEKALIDLKKVKEIHPVSRGNKLIHQIEKLIDRQNI
ncbi:2-hydroxy-6-oxo-2,4-heptadienoate hydrolase [Candidatus Pelagibacter sp.]|nr:2-hydroxy-6-oxo-2,4-heptadienoate hydrolase [Candidatus Pelagibacter sp.]